jgi:hypothetical protein
MNTKKVVLTPVLRPFYKCLGPVHIALARYLNDEAWAIVSNYKRTLKTLPDYG